MIPFVSRLGPVAAALACLCLQPAIAQEVLPAKPAPTKIAPPTPQDAEHTPGAPQSGGNSWFPVTGKDLGTYFGEGEATGTFPFKNPTNDTVEWSNLTGSCQCSRAIIRIGDRRYQLTKQAGSVLQRITRGPDGTDKLEPVTKISVGPGEDGEVEIHLDMHNVQTRKEATLDIHSTDETLPQLKLRWWATGALQFVISPAEVQLNKMTWNETRDFTVTVTSPRNKDFNILRMDPAKSFDVKYEKAVADGIATWTIQGKYGPVTGEGDDGAANPYAGGNGGGVLKFYTDVNGQASFSVRVMAFVQGPLDVKPGGFMTLGMIRKGTALTKEVTFEPNDGTELAMKGFRLEKLTVPEQFVHVTSRKDGKNLVVTFEIGNDAPAGLLKGDLVVELNHPLVPEKRIMFNGFVR